MKLKYQIEKLIRFAVLNDHGETDESTKAQDIDDRLTFRPNLSSFSSAPNENETEELPSMDSSSAKYVIPKLREAAFEDKVTKDEKLKARAIAKAKRSKMARMLLEEYGDKPETQHYGQITGAKFIFSIP